MEIIDCAWNHSVRIRYVVLGSNILPVCEMITFTSSECVCFTYCYGLCWIHNCPRDLDMTSDSGDVTTNDICRCFSMLFGRISYLSCWVYHNRHNGSVCSYTTRKVWCCPSTWFSWWRYNLVLFFALCCFYAWLVFTVVARLIFRELFRRSLRAEFAY